MEIALGWTWRVPTLFGSKKGWKNDPEKWKNGWNGVFSLSEVKIWHGNLTKKWKRVRFWPFWGQKVDQNFLKRVQGVPYLVWRQKNWNIHFLNEFWSLWIGKNESDFGLLKPKSGPKWSLSASKSPEFNPITIQGTLEQQFSYLFRHRFTFKVFLKLILPRS